MDGLGQLFKFSHHKLARIYDIGAMFYKFPVPKIKLVPLSAVLPDQSEEVISLSDNLVVLLEGAEISRIDLGVGQVQVTAASRGGPGNEVDVLGAKKYHIHLADKVDGAAVDTVKLDPLLHKLGLKGLWRGGCPLVSGVCTHEGYLQLNRTITFLNLG